MDPLWQFLKCYILLEGKIVDVNSTNMMKYRKNKDMKDMEHRISFDKRQKSGCSEEPKGTFEQLFIRCKHQFQVNGLTSLHVIFYSSTTWKLLMIFAKCLKITKILSILKSKTIFCFNNNNSLINRRQLHIFFYHAKT